MKKAFIELSIRGVFCKVPAIFIDDLAIIILGKFLKTATIKDEWWLEGDIICDPYKIIDILKNENIGADIFVFSQKLPSIEPKYNFHMEWSSVAAIPIISYSDWWENYLPQVTRKNVRRAFRRGVVVKRIEFSDRLIEAIVRLNNSTPIRQRTRNVHYGKSFEAVKKDYSDFSNRSDYLGAYFKNEMIGLLRIIYQGDIANIMQLFCMPQHNDKRPANTLIASAVELCENKKIKHLVFGQYIYGRNVKAPLTEFKRRNGFVEYLVPSYYIPLTGKGRIAIMLDMHRGIQFFIPDKIMHLAFDVRKWIKRKINRETHSDNP